MTAATAGTDTEPVSVPPAERFGEKRPGDRHPLLQKRVFIPILVLLFVLNIPFFHLFLRGAQSTSATIPFIDDYERPELGKNYFATGGFWRLVNGWVYSPGAKNNPLWLRAKLPRDVVVEFDAKSDSPDGDVKCEIFGDGRDHSTGYLLVFGGWHNSRSTIARLYEHGTEISNLSGEKKAQAMQDGIYTVSRTDRKMERNRIYHWKVVRDGKLLTWYIDGDLFLQLEDPHPLYGPENDRFAFGTWATDAYFKNLSITPLH
jgi:hypothetical protein